MDYHFFAAQTMSKIIKKLEKTSFEIGAQFPHVAKKEKYDNAGAEWWTSGFWPGILWLAFQASKNEKFAELAKEIEEKMDEVLNGYEYLSHDVGFMWMLSSGANYMMTGSEESRLRLLKAASHLASRFNLKGNYIRAWGIEFSYR